eukprot:2075527-Amphidinium_carterae.1
MSPPHSSAYPRSGLARNVEQGARTLQRAPRWLRVGNWGPSTQIFPPRPPWASVSRIHAPILW